MNNILHVTEEPVSDESIIKYEFHSHLPYSTSNLGNNDEIRIPIHQQDQLSLPSESRLYFEGTLDCGLGQKNFKNADGISENAMLHLFSEIRYELNGVIIDRVRTPGVSTLLKGKPLITTSEYSRLSNSSVPPLTLHNIRDKKFNFVVPLKFILGFFEDFQKVLINVKQELVLIRSRTNDNAIFDIDGDSQFDLKLTSVQWQIPFIAVNDTARLYFMDILQKNKILQMAYRTHQLYEYPNIPATSSFTWPVRMSTPSERPRFVIVGFQTGRKDEIKKESSHFDQCDVRQIRVHLGSESYPYTPFDNNFGDNKDGVLFEHFINLRKAYYEKTEDYSAVNITLFRTRYPLWVIDCSRQNETVKQGAVDVRLDITAGKNFPTGTTAYCLLISDCLVEYSPFSGLVRQII